MKLAANPLSARALALASPTAQEAGPSELDFGPLFESAIKRQDPALLSQLVNLTMLKSSIRLADPAPVTTAQGSMPVLLGNRLVNLPGQTPALPASAEAMASAAPAPASPPTQQTAWADSAENLTPASAKSSPSLPASRHAVDGIIVSAAARHGVDPNLVRAVVTAESDFDHKSVSSAGAMGLMQLMPGTAKDLGVKNPFDPAQNIEGGTRYLAQLLARFDGDEKKALAAYNWGASNVERGGSLPAETRTYLVRVARYKQMYTGGFSTKA